MHVTQIANCGKLRYVHVTINTYSSFFMASAQTKTATKHVITHCLQCFLYMGIPKFIKMDNGFGYTDKAFQQFCSQCNIKHKTGSPYNPQGQGIMERAHGSLRNSTSNDKDGGVIPSVVTQRLKPGPFYSKLPECEYL